MPEVVSNQSFIAPYVALEPLAGGTDATTDMVESPGLDKPSGKYEIPLCDRSTLNVLVDHWLMGDRHAFDPHFATRDRVINSVSAKTYARRRALQNDAQQFFLGVGSECLAQKRRYAREMRNVPKRDPGGQLMRLLDACPGVVLGEVHSHVGARKLLIENMPALKAQGVERLYMEHLLTDVHGDALAELNGSPHTEISAGVARYLRAQDNGWAPVSKLDRVFAEKYSYEAVVDAAHRAGISVIAIDCAASYFLKGGESYADDSDVWRIPVMNYFSYLVINETSHARDRVPRDGQDGKWIALVGNTHMSVFDGVPGLSELMGVPGVRFEDAMENRVGADTGFEIKHPSCFVGDMKNILVKGDFIFRMDVREPGAEQTATPHRPSFLRRAVDYLSCYPGARRA